MFLAAEGINVRIEGIKPDIEGIHHRVEGITFELNEFRRPYTHLRFRLLAFDATGILAFCS